MTKTQKITTCNMPALAPREDWEDNFQTHHFIDDRCADCDVRPYGRAATWPCGTDEPRVVQNARLAFQLTDDVNDL